MRKKFAKLRPILTFREITFYEIIDLSNVVACLWLHRKCTFLFRPKEAGLDAIDRKILDILQADATVPVATIAEKVGLSAAPCWRRIKRMEDDGVIRRRVALIDRRKANVPMTLFVSVRTTRHAVKWLEDFRRVISDIPEIVEAWRLTGDIDYLLRIVVPDVDTYDTVYKRLINRLEFADISSAIAMEEMKYTTAIPTNYLVR
jgi:Lrp/AsnC family transcriptional regulator